VLEWSPTGDNGGGICLGAGKPSKEREGARMSDPPPGVWEERRHPLREE
jgi:hypothetical protein